MLQLCKETSNLENKTNSYRPVHEALVAAQRLHDEQVVQLVVRLGVVRAHPVVQVRAGGATPITQHVRRAAVGGEL